MVTGDLFVELFVFFLGVCDKETGLRELQVVDDEGLRLFQLLLLHLLPMSL